MSEVVLHTPEQIGDRHCRKVWGVLGTAGEPAVHYCVAPVVHVPVAEPDQAIPYGVEHKRPEQTRREHADSTHRCRCGASSHEQGARLVCRFRERGQDPCGRAIYSVTVERTPAGHRSMPCGHPVTAISTQPAGAGANRRRKRR